MTVKYATEIATNSNLGGLARLLLKWKGSVYKVVWAEYLVFLTLYFIISGIYRFILDDDEKRSFEKIANFCEKAKDSFRIYFILGFFATSMVSKWWKMYDMIPSIDPIAHYVYAGIHGDDDQSKKFRISIVRHSCLSLMLTFLKISPPLKLKYPKLDDLIKEKMLTAEEKEKLEKVRETAEESDNWLPIKWATDLVLQAVQEKKTNDYTSKILDQLDKLRNGLSLLLEYEHNSVPLAYVQVVTISVYTYFFSCLLGRQWMEENNRFPHLDLYFPIVTTLEFFFYIGWLKVAGSMINPFGGDDDDFDLEGIAWRNLIVTTAMVNRKDYKEPSIEDYKYYDYVFMRPANRHRVQKDTKINCENNLDPEQIPLSSRPED